MNSLSRSVQPPVWDSMTIGELAEITGVRTATLRAWEKRHAFPVPERRPSGHRRYTVAHVDAVRQVLRRQQEGVRLDVAIAEVLAEDEAAGRAAGARPPVPGRHSVYAAVRRHQPGLVPHRLSKPTLLALSWAIEDEFCSRAMSPHLFGSFQLDSYFRAARARWDDLARGAATCTVLADFSGTGPDEPARGAEPDEPDEPDEPGRAGGRVGVPRTVHLPPDAPLRREWAVVCDADDLPAVLTAWELPGQGEVPSRDRLFEAVWTIDRRASRAAARVCAEAAQEAGAAWAGDLVDTLAPEPGPSHADLDALTSMFNRMVAYVDHQYRR